MLKNTAHFKGLVVRATDGELGTVDELYFDDESWAVRYLTVETGGWLGGRSVLISPMSVTEADWPAKQLDVALTKKQVENSPDISTHAPIARRHERAYLSYYGYPYYWEGPHPWGSASYPSALVSSANLAGEAKERMQAAEQDTHLRSTAAITGYHIDASDGEIGHVDGFIVDDEAWAIRYMEVATQNWWPGKTVLISPEWIEKMSWRDEKVYVGLLRDAIQSGPRYDGLRPITREYEDRLHTHYGRPPYWMHETEPEFSFARSGD
jgi:hypothetical protein